MHIMSSSFTNRYELFQKEKNDNEENNIMIEKKTNKQKNNKELIVGVTNSNITSPQYFELFFIQKFVPIKQFFSSIESVDENTMGISGVQRRSAFSIKIHQFFGTSEGGDYL